MRRSSARRLAVLALGASLFVTACSESENPELAPPADPGAIGDLSGSYVVNGFDPLGSEYGGSLTIEADGAGGYRLQWIITGSLQEGEGTLSGNRLEVEWHTIDGPASAGTAGYVVTSAGELDGTRMVDGYNGVGVEQAYPIP